jgi:hypothetical protein
MPELAGSCEFVRVLFYSMKGLAPPRGHPIVSVVSLVNAVSCQSWPTILLILRFQARIFRISPHTLRRVGRWLPQKLTGIGPCAPLLGLLV